jgi:predicted aspartyl protease
LPSPERGPTLRLLAILSCPELRSTIGTLVRRSQVLIALFLLVLAGCQQGSGCDVVKVSQVPLEVRGQLFAVPLTLGNHTLNMLLDTGAQRSLLDEATVRRLKIPQDGRTFTVMVGMAGGSPRADANVEGVLLGDAPLSVSRMPVSTSGGLARVDGVLGLDVLRGYDLNIDGPNRMLALYRVRRCERADPPWDEAAVSIDGTDTRTGWLRMPLEIDGVAATAVVDTGASYTFIRPRLMGRIGLTEQAMTDDRTIKLHVLAGSDIQARVHRIKTIRLGPITVHDASIVVLVQEPPALGGGRQFEDAVVGQDLLRNRRVWFSIATGRLYLSRRDDDTVAEPGRIGR